MNMSEWQRTPFSQGWLEAQPAGSLQGKQCASVSKRHWLQPHLCPATCQGRNQALTCSYDDDCYLPVFPAVPPFTVTSNQRTRMPRNRRFVPGLSCALNCPEHFLSTIAVMDRSAISFLISAWWTRFFFPQAAQWGSPVWRENVMKYQRSKYGVKLSGIGYKSRMIIWSRRGHQVKPLMAGDCGRLRNTKSLDWKIK